MDSSPFPRDRAEREAEIRALEDELADRIRGRLTAIVTGAFRAFLATLTAAGDTTKLDTIPSQWATFVAAELGDDIGDIYLRGAVTAWARSQAAGVVLPEGFPELWSAAMNDMAVTYQTLAENRIVGIGQTLWADIREDTVRAIANGVTTEDLKGRIEDLTGFSEFKADTIARTETHRAAMMGDRAGAKALGQYGPVEHVWVAVLDARTRPEHAEANGQYRPFDEPYDVGGERILHPGEGSPENAVNCRCWEEYLYPGDIRPDGSQVPE